MPTDPNAIEQARKPLPLDEAARRLVKAANWMYDVLVGRGMAGGYDAAAMERASDATLSAIRKVEASLALLSGVPEDVEALAKWSSDLAKSAGGEFREKLKQIAATLRAQAAQLAARPAPEDAVLIQRLRTDIRIDNEPPNYELQRRQAADRIEALSAQVAEVTRENDVLRGLLALGDKSCSYCGLAAEDIAKCASGFPGCARADDMLASPFNPPAPAPDVLAQVEAEVRAEFDVINQSTDRTGMNLGRVGAYANCLAIIRRAREGQQ